MPITNVPPLPPLSASWTHGDLIEEARVITHETENENLQDFNIATHLNVCIANIAELLNLANEPWYAVSWPASTTAASGDVPVLHIDLTSTVDSIIPLQKLWKVDRLSAFNASPAFLDNCAWYPYETILFQSRKRGATAMNSKQFDDTVMWCHRGSYIYLYVPTAMSTVYTSLSFFVEGYRQPNLIVPTDRTQYNVRVDLPDRHIRLCLMMLQKMILEQLNKTVEPNLEAAIMQNTQTIYAGVAAEMQHAQALKQKTEYDFRTR